MNRAFVFKEKEYVLIVRDQLSCLYPDLSRQKMTSFHCSKSLFQKGEKKQKKTNAQTVTFEGSLRRIARHCRVASSYKPLNICIQRALISLATGASNSHRFVIKCAFHLAPPLSLTFLRHADNTRDFVRSQGRWRRGCPPPITRCSIGVNLSRFSQNTILSIILP